ncbi:MAG: hypothetical protein ACLUVC_02325 [Longibaculum sp.]
MENKFEKQIKEAQGKRISRAKAIRYKCLDCCGFSPSEVRECTSYTCPLWRYRMGREEKDELYYSLHQKKDGDDVV